MLRTKGEAGTGTSSRPSDTRGAAEADQDAHDHGRIELFVAAKEMQSLNSSRSRRNAMPVVNFANVRRRRTPP